MSEARHIQSMIDFIEREAQEKVEELEAAAQEEYDVEKMRVVETEKSKIRAQTEKKKIQVDIDCRVSKANFSKTQRMRIMAERAKVMEDLQEVTKKNILQTVANASMYETLLRDLLRQSVLSLRSSAVVACSKEDESVVNRLLKGVAEWYQTQTKEKVTLTVGKNSLNKKEIWGGVVVTSADGRIVCDNTLAHRTKTVFDEQLPTVRYYLFNPEVSL